MVIRFLPGVSWASSSVKCHGGRARCGGRRVPWGMSSLTWKSYSRVCAELEAVQAGWELSGLKMPTKTFGTNSKGV